LHSKIGFPVEKYFNLIDPGVERSTIAEPTRLTIVRKYRGKKRWVMFGLGAIAYRYTRQNDIRYWYATLPEKLANSFKRFDLNFVKLSEQPPTAYNIQNRKEIKGYFEQKKLEPFILDIETI